MMGELQAGDPSSIGPYRLLGRLGTGGMGQVYLGRSVGGRLVAVKVIRPDLAEEQDFRSRFSREVTAARNVNGQFTALVAGADVDGPVPWLATAYVPGPSLSEAVAEQGPMAPSSVMMLAAGLAEGLGAIHAAGVVHRDLKPSNVLLADDGPRVIDFGISRATEASMLTQVGTVVGSPGFMSPEQAEGGAVGPLSDVFSLGAVLTFAATGAGPFGSGSTPALVYRVVHSDPDIAGLPDELKRLVRRCLAKDPAGRPTTDELLAELSASHGAEDWFSEPIARLLSGHAQPGPGPASPVPYPAPGGSPAPDAAARLSGPEPPLADVIPDAARPADVIPAWASPDAFPAAGVADGLAGGGVPLDAASGAPAASAAGDRPDSQPARLIAAAGPAAALADPAPADPALADSALADSALADPGSADAPTGLVPAAVPADPDPDLADPVAADPARADPVAADPDLADPVSPGPVPADPVPADDVPTGLVRVRGRPGSGPATRPADAGPGGIWPGPGAPGGSGPAPGDGGERQPRRRRRAWAAAGLAVLVVLSASAAIALRMADHPSPADTVQGPRSAASAPGGLSGSASSGTDPASGARPAAAMGSVSPVHGMTLSAASTALSARGFDNITYASNCYGSADVGHVVRQSPAAGAHVALSTPVLLYLQAGNCATVPNVSGMDLTQATAALKVAGFASVPYQYDCYGFTTVGEVVSQSPAGKTRAATNQPVLLELQAGDCS